MGSRTLTIIKYVFLIVCIVPMLFPFIWMVLTSLKPFGEVFSLDLLPSSPTLDNYIAAVFAHDVSALVFQ